MRRLLQAASALCCSESHERTTAPVFQCAHQNNCTKRKTTATSEVSVLFVFYHMVVGEIGNLGYWSQMFSGRNFNTLAKELEYE